MNKFIKFTRDCLALGEHREVGTIQELPEKTCAELVAEGAATYFTKPENDTIETAVAPIQDAEKAIIKTTKVSKAKK